MQKKALILTDGKAGHENQSKAFARMLGCEFDIEGVSFRSRFAKALSYLADAFSVRTLRLFKEERCLREICGRGGYGVVIGTGSGTFYAAKVLARRMGVKCGVVLYPRGYSIASFGCIMAPAIDRPPALRNVIEIPANLVANDAAFYAAGVEAFRQRHSPGERKAVAVIVGGPNRCSTMTAGWMRSKIDEIFAATPDCEHWVTTSRRTPEDVEAVVDSYPWDYKLIYSRDRFNPIPAFVALSSRLYVTAESTGMLSESCTCGKAEVHALDNLKAGDHKFRRFLDSLAAGGYVGASRKVDLSCAIVEARALLGFG